MTEPISIVPGKPDAEVAAELKAELEEKLIEVCKVLDKAEAAGFTPGFGTGKGPLGKWIVTQLIVARQF